MQQREGIAGLALLPDADGEKLGRILTAALGKLPAPDQQNPPPTWRASYLGLPQVRLFQEASLGEQQAIVELASRGLLEEAYWIEKVGMGYMARMVLLAQTLQERMLYSLFTADEAAHLAQLRPFLASEPVATQDPFLHLLAEVVETCDRAVLVFVLQVVLEGWGLTHYRSLASGCESPALSRVFAGFLEAESRHQGTGLVLFQQISLSGSDQQAIVEVLTRFLQMVRVGPQRLLAAIAAVKGGLSQPQQIQALTELDTQTHSRQRLQLLRSLMKGPAAGAIVQQLEERGLFQPLPPHQCVHPLLT